MAYLVLTEEKPIDYEELIQSHIDFNRGGGFVGDSDLKLQIELTYMELDKNPNIPTYQKHLENLYKLQEKCKLPGGHIIEWDLKTPQDIESSLIEHILQ